MGIGGPRSPAVHRGARVLDAISSGAANTPAALSGLLALPKSSIADLVGTMADAGLIARDTGGGVHTGPRWSELSDPAAITHRVFRACATTDLDGHTVSLARLLGNQVVFVDVRLGRHPLPLTPRPGQRANADDCAAAAAILSAMSQAEAVEIIGAAAAHLGLTDHDVQHAAAMRHARRRKVYEAHSPRMGPQSSCPVAGTRYALTLHVPQRWPEAKVRKAISALHGAANDY